MRDLAKSMIRFSWAMSLFGLEQLGNLLREREEEEESREEKISQAFDSVTEATNRSFEERMQNLFEAGDRLQVEMVDLMFDVLDSDSLKPERMLDRVADAADRSADRLRDAAKDRREAEPDA